MSQEIQVMGGGLDLVSARYHTTAIHLGSTQCNGEELSKACLKRWNLENLKHSR